MQRNIFCYVVCVIFSLILFLSSLLNITLPLTISGRGTSVENFLCAYIKGAQMFPKMEEPSEHPRLQKVGIK